MPGILHLLAQGGIDLYGKSGKPDFPNGFTINGETQTLSLAELSYLDGVTAGAVTASKALVVDASKMLSADASGTAGVLQIQMTSDGTTAARAFKSRAFSATSGNCGDAIGVYGLAEMQGTATLAANSTLAGFLSWTTVLAANTVSAGDIIACYRGILDFAQDLGESGTYETAIFYGNLWNTAGGACDAGLRIAVGPAGDPAMAAVVSASSGTSTSYVKTFLDAKKLKFGTGAGFMDLPDDGVVVDLDWNVSTNTSASDGAIKVLIDGTDYYIPVVGVGKVS